jgi:hypothetical protein
MVLLFPFDQCEWESEKVDQLLEYLVQWLCCQQLLIWVKKMVMVVVVGCLCEMFQQLLVWFQTLNVQLLISLVEMVMVECFVVKKLE